MSSMAVRLQKYLAECSVASRRECEKIIAQGRVAINGNLAKVGDSVDAATDTVSLDGEVVRQDRKVYVVLHKPKGVVTSVTDTHDRRTVLDCISGVRARIFPVGRLDMDVAGALILTNDGELTYRLSHPKYEVDKIYLAWVEGRVSQSTARRLELGVMLDDGATAPATVSILEKTRAATLIRLVIHEGRKRMVKRMFAAVGHPVRDLRRAAIGSVRSEGLIPGEWRYLNDAEVDGLRKLTGLA